jgi:hypothetical protein
MAPEFEVFAPESIHTDQAIHEFDELLKEKTAKLTGSGDLLIIDLSKTTNICGDAVGPVIAAWRVAKKLGCHVTILASEQATKIFEMMGLSEALPDQSPNPQLTSAN